MLLLRLAHKKNARRQHRCLLSALAQLQEVRARQRWAAGASCLTPRPTPPPQPAQYARHRLDASAVAALLPAEEGTLPEEEQRARVVVRHAALKMEVQYNAARFFHQVRRGEDGSSGPVGPVWVRPGRAGSHRALTAASWQISLLGHATAQYRAVLEIHDRALAVPCVAGSEGAQRILRDTSVATEAAYNLSELYTASGNRQMAVAVCRQYLTL